MFTFLLYQIQKVVRGWDDSETWDFQHSFLKWIYPRLKRFRKISITYPPKFTEEEWNKFLDSLVTRTEKVLTDYERIDEMSWDEQEQFEKEKNFVVQTLCDNLKDFGW